MQFLLILHTCACRLQLWHALILFLRVLRPPRSRAGMSWRPAAVEKRQKSPASFFAWWCGYSNWGYSWCISWKKDYFLKNLVYEWVKECMSCSFSWNPEPPWSKQQFWNNFDCSEEAFNCFHYSGGSHAEYTAMGKLSQCGQVEWVVSLTMFFLVTAINNTTYSSSKNSFRVSWEMPISCCKVGLFCIPLYDFCTLVF